MDLIGQPRSDRVLPRLMQPAIECAPWSCTQESRMLKPSVEAGSRTVGLADPGGPADSSEPPFASGKPQSILMLPAGGCREP